MAKEIKRGEIYWLNWYPSRGSEQNGTRPALIIQNDVGNTFGNTTIVAACTTADVKPYPFIVPVTREESGLPKDGKINLSVIITVDKSRLGAKCGELTGEKMAEVNKALKISLNLD